MNLFILSLDHETNARYHADKHVVKMGLEATQLLCTIARERCDIDIGYKSTYANHPVTQWVGACDKNFRWTIEYAKAIFTEYAYRYKRVHNSISVLLEIMLVQYEIMGMLSETAGTTPFHLAVSPELKHLEPVLAYRAYYLKTKKRLFKWTKREVPSWIVDPPYEIRDYL